MKTEYLSIYAICEQLNLNTRNVNSLIRKGDLKAYLFGKEIRVKAEDLRDYIKRSRIMNSYLTNLSEKFKARLFSSIQEGTNLSEATESLKAQFPDEYTAYAYSQGDYNVNAGEELNKIVAEKMRNDPKLPLPKAFERAADENKILAHLYSLEIQG